MTLIKTKSYQVLDMPSLCRSVLKSIYEPQNMDTLERGVMEHSIMKWHKYLSDRLSAPKDHQSIVDQENMIVLEFLGTLIHQNESGQLEGRKEMITKHGIDYRKLPQHRLPEAYTKKDFVIAQAQKKEYDKDHKEQESVHAD